MVTKKRHQGILSLPKIVTIITFTLVAILMLDFGRKALDSYHVDRQVEWLREQVAVEEQENEALQTRLEYVQSDAYVEKIARERLKMVKPGESAVVVVPLTSEPSAVASEQPVSDAPDDEPKPYWQQWADLLFGATF